MKATIKEFVAFAAPTIKDAFVHAAKVAAYIVLSAALEAVASYVAAKPFDPVEFAAINVFLASARKALESATK